MRCADCAHWVTHRGHDVVRRLSHLKAVSNTFDPVVYGDDGGKIGQCDRAGDPGARMDAVCTSEGTGGELLTEPNFGCVEFAPAPAGWDHHRFHREVDLGGGRYGSVVDDSAHAEGRF